MDMATRYPEAIPLRNISAPKVVNELLKFFTKMGFPLEVQSDQGSNFMSNIFQQTLRELGITHVKSSVYHPESQGALERYHQTLKCMIRKYCLETQSDWDKGIHFLLFATREVPNESLGFSPNELLFGHQVRGPLGLLKDEFVGGDNTDGLLQHVLTVKNHLSFACEFAAANLNQSKTKMKVWYDKKAREREFQKGDEVLVLLPITGQPLAAKFRGPYNVVRKINATDYIVATPDRRKPQQIFHINMLKPYCRAPNNDNSESIALCIERDISLGELEDENNSYPPGEIESFSENSNAWQDLSNNLSHLSRENAHQLVNILSETPELFREAPGRTCLAVHDVDVGDAVPIKQSPYRVSPKRRSILQQELEYMLQHRLIQRGAGAWSSPVTLVPKPGGKFRFCIDYRRVNSVTKTDSYPLPRIDDCIDQIGTASFITKIDLMKGYWQVPLTPRAKEISCFVANNQTFYCEVMPYGMKNAPATFQRLMNHICFDIPGCVVYIDDILLFSHTWEDHMNQIRLLCCKLSHANLVINLQKCDFVKSTVQYLGYKVGQGEVAPPSAKVEAILNFPFLKPRKTFKDF